MTTPPQTPHFDAPEKLISETRRVRCDGGGGALGHPVVFYDMGDHDSVECLYCDRLYVLRGSRQAAALGLGS